MDIDRSTLEYAKSKGYIDHYWQEDQLTKNKILDQLDVVVLAAPVLQIKNKLGTLLNHLDAHSDACSLSLTITDVGSTKGDICDLAWSKKEGYRFVGAHPMAGKERSGVWHARSDLYMDATIFLCGQKDGENKSNDHDRLPESKATPGMKIAAFWQELGGVISEVEPHYHDEIVACTSHLPHLLSMTLMNFLGNHERMKESLFQEQKKWFGGGLVDFTRIAASSPFMWQDIFLENKNAIVQILQKYQMELNEFLRLLQQENPAQIFDYLQRSEQLRNLMIPPKEHE